MWGLWCAGGEVSERGEWARWGACGGESSLSVAEQDRVEPLGHLLDAARAAGQAQPASGGRGCGWGWHEEEGGGWRGVVGAEREGEGVGAVGGGGWRSVWGGVEGCVVVCGGVCGGVWRSVWWCVEECVVVCGGVCGGVWLAQEGTSNPTVSPH